MPIFALNVHLISPIFLKSFPVFPILLFSSISVNLVSEVKLLSWVQLFETSWTETYQTYHETYQASLSTGFSRQEYWSGLPFPSPGDLPDLGIEPRSPALQTDALPSELPGKLDISPGNPSILSCNTYYQLITYGK